MTTLTEAVDANGFAITNLPDGTSLQDAATVNQLAGYVPGSRTAGADFATTNTDTSTALYAPVQNVLNVAPSAASQAISFGSMWQTVYSGTADITAGGHIVGAMGWGANISSTGTNVMGIGVEGRYDHTGTGTPTTTRAHGLLGLVANANGTMTGAYGSRTEFQLASGATITEAYGYQTNVSVNAGTFTKFVGFGMPLMTGVVVTPTTMLFLENLETQAPIVSKSPIIDQAYAYIAGAASGFSYTVPINITDLQIIPSAAIALGTVVLPVLANCTDGMELVIGTTQAITGFTLTAGTGTTVYGAPTTLAANACVRFKFYGQGIDIWVKR